MIPLSAERVMSNFGQLQPDRCSRVKSYVVAFDVGMLAVKLTHYQSSMSGKLGWCPKTLRH